MREHLATIGDHLSDRIARGTYHEMADGVFPAPGAKLGQYVVTDTQRGPIVLGAERHGRPVLLSAGPAHLGAGCRVIEHAAIKDGVAIWAHDQDRRRGRGLDHRALHQQAASRLSGPQLPGQLGQPGGRHLQQRSEKHLRPGEHGVPRPQGRHRHAVRRLRSIGDYAKTAINTGIFTGKTIGVCSMVYGFVTTNVPSFVNYARLVRPGDRGAGRSAWWPRSAACSQRRGVVQRPCDIQLLHDMYELTAHERQMPGEALSLEPLSL